MNGVDYLGLGHRKFPLRYVARHTPAGAPIGLFLDTFGDGPKQLRKLFKLYSEIAKPLPCAVRIHIWWSNQHVIAPVNAVKKGSIVCEKLALEFPSVTFYVSHSCEHDEKNKAVVKKRMELVRKFAPSCVPVNCVGKGATLLGVINENHPHEGKSSLKPPYIVSNDGKGIFEMNPDKFMRDHKDAKLCLLWTYEFNLREPGEKKPPPPKLRTKVPSEGIIEAVCNLLS